LYIWGKRLIIIECFSVLPLMCQVGKLPRTITISDRVSLGGTTGCITRSMLLLTCWFFRGSNQILFEVCRGACP